MDTIAVSEFKATCTAVVERVRKTRRPVVITRHGKPVAELVPLEPQRREKNWLGSMADVTEIRGDLVAPVSSEEDWEAAK